MFEVPETPEDCSYTPNNLNCCTDENGDYVCNKEPSKSPSLIPCECGTANPTRINQNRIMYATGTEADFLEIFLITDQIKKLTSRMTTVSSSKELKCTLLG